MGLSASQGRLLLLTAKQSDLEFRAQQISQKRLVLAQQLEEISKAYEDATSDRVMSISMYEEGIDTDGKKVQTTGNLTYKNLISGTITDSAIAASAGLNTGVYEVGASSNKPYRLVDTSGAIVVASEDEIPLSKTSDDTTYTAAVKNSKGIYTQTISSYSDTDGEKNSLYFIPPANSDLATVFEDYRKSKSKDGSDDESVTLECSYDSTNNLIQIGGKNYKLNGKLDTTSTFTKSDTITLASKEDYIPKSSTTTQQKKNYTKKEGSDNHFTLYDDKGRMVARYVVDPGLKYGSSDSGNAADPNYLQDCLRNGKYLIEQYHKNDDNTGTISWDQISWDATSNISDRYYTENDAEAKAKYDRAQSEIQNADKKLELELDQVEAQRNAVKTEIESVQKVMNDNIEKSFKPFQA